MTEKLEDLLLTDQEIKNAYRSCKTNDFIKSINGFEIERALCKAQLAKDQSYYQLLLDQKDAEIKKLKEELETTGNCLCLTNEANLKGRNRLAALEAENQKLKQITCQEHCIGVAVAREELLAEIRTYLADYQDMFVRDFEDKYRVIRSQDLIKTFNQYFKDKK